MLTDYTTPETVRALLGINKFEVTDAQLALPVYATVIDESFEDLNTSLSANYAAVTVVPENDRTTVQRRFLAAAKIYAALAVALALLPTLPMAAPRKVGDGDAVQERIQNPYDLLVENLRNSMLAMGLKLLALLALIDPTAPGAPVVPPRVYAVNVPLLVDPVTGA